MLCCLPYEKEDIRWYSRHLKITNHSVHIYSDAIVGSSRSDRVVAVAFPMAGEYVRNLWHVRLCRHGPKCDHKDCGFAHNLSDLRAPNESERLYGQAWEKNGVDRWYGQHLTDEQIHIIQSYYELTPERCLTAWSRALRYCISGVHDVTERHHPWDYGLSMDLELLCLYRKTRLPFRFHDKIWEKLEVRKEKLQEEQRKKRRLNMDL